MNSNQILDSTELNHSRHNVDQRLPRSITGTLLKISDPIRRNNIQRGPHCDLLHQEKEQTPKITALSQTIPTTSAIFNTLLIQEARYQALRAARQQLLGLNSNTNVINQNRNDLLNVMILPQQSMRLNQISCSGLLSVGRLDNSRAEVCNDPSYATFEMQNMPTQSQSLDLPPSKQKGRPSRFVQKLHQMLSDLERQPGGTEIASYVENGRAFKIHDPKRFVKEIIPQYFSMKFMESFKRQLASYNFQQIPYGPDRGAYFNEFFVRGQPGLCARIKRIAHQQQKLQCEKLLR